MHCHPRKPHRDSLWPAGLPSSQPGSSRSRPCPVPYHHCSIRVVTSGSQMRTGVGVGVNVGVGVDVGVIVGVGVSVGVAVAVRVGVCVGGEVGWVGVRVIGDAGWVGDVGWVGEVG